jgi:hypothetical protein
MKIKQSLAITLLFASSFLHGDEGAIPQWGGAPPSVYPSPGNSQRVPPSIPKPLIRPRINTPGGLANESVYPLPSTDNTQGRTSNISVTEAQDEASQFMNLIDAGQYGGAWADASPIMKDVITQSQWISAMTETRRKLGNVLSRKLVSNKSRNILPFGTQGNFMILQYRTLFSWNVYQDEIIVLTTNEREQWRVFSYTLQSQQQ